MSVSDQPKPDTENLQKRPFGVLCWNCGKQVLLGYVWLRANAQIEDLRAKVPAFGGQGDYVVCESVTEDGSVCNSANLITKEEVVFADAAIPVYDAGIVYPTF
jgi:hypothetical protein